MAQTRRKLKRRKTMRGGALETAAIIGIVVAAVAVVGGLMYKTSDPINTDPEYKPDPTGDKPTRSFFM